MQYTAISSRDRETHTAFYDAVREKLAEGWVPLGGIQVPGYMVQPLVKKRSTPTFTDY
jgi:hypothetical protein